MGFLPLLEGGTQIPRVMLLLFSAPLNPLVLALFYFPAILSYCQLDKQQKPAPELLKSNIYRITIVKLRASPLDGFCQLFLQPEEGGQGLAVNDFSR